MKMIRTTLTLPVTLHEDLRHQAVKEHISLNDVILRQLVKASVESSQQRQVRVSKQLQEDLAFFDILKKEYPTPIDPVKTIHEARAERERRYE